VVQYNLLANDQLIFIKAMIAVLIASGVLSHCSTTRCSGASSVAKKRLWKHFLCSAHAARHVWQFPQVQTESSLASESYPSSIPASKDMAGKIGWLLWDVVDWLLQLP
jgi:hypothetical protein